jgi:hypothetical protein
MCRVSQADQVDHGVAFTGGDPALLHAMPDRGNRVTARIATLRGFPHMKMFL